MANEDEQKTGQQHPKGELRFNQQQYDFLRRCSEKGKEGIREWNQCRKKNIKDDIFLEGAELSGLYLKGVYLRQVGVTRKTPAKLESFIGGEAYLRDAKMKDADLEDADFRGAHLENARFNRANLEKSKFRDAHLEGTVFFHAHLEKSNLQTTIVDGETSFWECYIDKHTDFRGVGLNSCRIDAGTKQLLEYNIRRLNWEDWYKKHPKIKLLVKPFWLMSDYGRSIGWLIITFFALAFVFAAIYYVYGILNPPGIVNSLFEGKEGLVPVWLVPFRTIYFSIVTMTTLGFGDMHANCQSFLGHILLTVQVILGYVLLGALVTRFAVLFTVGGPAGKFSPKKTKDGERLKV
jgi:hypothetical protein